MDAFLVDLCRTAAQGTVNSRRSQLAGFLGWCVSRNKTQVCDLSRTLIESYDAHRAARGAAGSTRRLCLAVLSRWWRWCYEHEDHGAFTPRPATITMPPRVVFETVAPLWEEVDAVVERARARYLGNDVRLAPIWRAIYRLAVLLRGTGLRLSQCLRLEWRDIDVRLGTLRIRPELGKSASERAGRTLPLPPWLLVELLTWEPEATRDGLFVWVPSFRRRDVDVGARVAVLANRGSECMHLLWTETAARPEVYVRRPDHAFRKALRTELLHQRCHPEAIEYWCGRSSGVRGVYTDPRAHDLVQIARSIPAPSCVPGVSRETPIVAPAQPYKRHAG